MFAFDRFIFTHARTHTHPDWKEKQTRAHKLIDKYKSICISKKKAEKTVENMHITCPVMLVESGQGGAWLGVGVGSVWPGLCCLRKDSVLVVSLGARKLFDFYLGPFSLNTLWKYWEDSLNIIFIFSKKILHFILVCTVKSIVHICIKVQTLYYTIFYV